MFIRKARNFTSTFVGPVQSTNSTFSSVDERAETCRHSNIHSNDEELCDWLVSPFQGDIRKCDGSSDGS